MHMVFKDLPAGAYFIDRRRQLAQKTSPRTARYVGDRARSRRALELAVRVPADTVCPSLRKPHDHPIKSS